MTEPEQAKPRLKKGRVLAWAMLFVVILALMLVVFDGSPSSPVSAKFVRFQKSLDGRFTEAVLFLTNQSDRELFFHWDEKSGDMVHKFVSPGTNGALAWGTPGDRMGGEWTFERLSDCTYGFQLPEDGRTGFVAFYLEMTPKQAPRFLHTARALFWKLFPPGRKGIWVLCDQEIQCPRVRPDGTVEPPRVIRKVESGG